MHPMRICSVPPKEASDPTRAWLPQIDLLTPYSLRHSSPWTPPKKARSHQSLLLQSFRHGCWNYAPRKSRDIMPEPSQANNAKRICRNASELSSHGHWRSLHALFWHISDLLGDEQRATNWMKTIKAVAMVTPLVKQYSWIMPFALKFPLWPLRVVLPDLSRIVQLRRVSITNETKSLPPKKRLALRLRTVHRTCERKPRKSSRNTAH